MGFGAITHYTRFAPLKSITNDFRRAAMNAEAKGQYEVGQKKKKANKHQKGSAPGSLDKDKITKLTHIELDKLNAEMEEVKILINTVYKQCRPRRPRTSRPRTPS